MPLGTYLVNKILKDLKNARREQKAPGLEPDAKAQITLLCEGRKAVKTATLLVSCQHQEKLTPEDVREIILEQLKASLPEEFIPAPQNILTNPAGRFIIGGPDGDTGLTGRKIIADTYGRLCPARGRSLFRQRRLQGGQVGSLHASLPGQKYRRRRAGRRMSAPDFLRHRTPLAFVAAHRLQRNLQS